MGELTEAEKKTALHDVESMKYLSYILYPLCFGGAVYSLLYTPHKRYVMYRYKIISYEYFYFCLLITVYTLIVGTLGPSKVL